MENVPVCHVAAGGEGIPGRKPQGTRLVNEVWKAWDYGIGYGVSWRSSDLYRFQPPTIVHNLTDGQGLRLKEADIDMRPEEASTRDKEVSREVAVRMFQS
jgi:hypothetical protein